MESRETDTHRPIPGHSKVHALGRGYIGARTDRIHQSRQTPDKEAEINYVTLYVIG
jgi:hypothetical protein